MVKIQHYTHPSNPLSDSDMSIPFIQSLLDQFKELHDAGDKDAGWVESVFFQYGIGM
jgi:hypothetical protein